MQDSNHRSMAAIWAAMSVAFFHVAWNPSDVVLFRFLMRAVNGAVRAHAPRYYRASAFMLPGIVIELITTALMQWMHAGPLNSGGLSGV